MAALALSLGRRRASNSLVSIFQRRCRCSCPDSTTSTSYIQESAAPSEQTSHQNNKEPRWLALPPYLCSVDPSTVGRELTKATRLNVNGSVSNSDAVAEAASTTTALKWVRRCCPGIPISLVQKLFRLRQVRKQVNGAMKDCLKLEGQGNNVKRVSSKDTIAYGDVILLPTSVQEFSPDKGNYNYNDDEINYARSMVLHKDPSIIVVNKPQGLPVQGGIGIKLSMDNLAAEALKYDTDEPPRLVHRLDRDSSGILVMGRTQTSASILHSIFREKTFEASTDVGHAQRILQRKYWALVIGVPRRKHGIISAALTKVVVENGKSERITVSNGTDIPSSQTAVTKYEVIGSSNHGYTWLELSPLTGRKHQLRVHCAEVLGTPIVGDLKYGWQAHRRWEPLPPPSSMEDHAQQSKHVHEIPFGLPLSGGSILDKKPRLHLHCRQMILPDIDKIVQRLHSPVSDCDFSKIESVGFVAPLSSHMQKSWDALTHT